jgi:restriction endonuclease S subunit
MKTNWPTKNLEDIAEFQNGLWTGKKAPFVAAPILRNTNFKNGDGSLNYDDVAEIEVEKKQLEKRTLSKGDILLERSGGGPTQPVGRVVYFEGENNRFGFSNFTTRIRVKGSNVDSKYLWFFLHSFYKSGKTELMQKKTTGIRNLTFSEYKQIKIPLLPLEVQKKIVAKVESLLAKVSEAKKLRAEAQENADNLLSAELHKIFVEDKNKGWEKKKLGEVLQYEQPQQYIVASTEYCNEYETPVLTPGKSFVRGYTNEKDSVFPAEKLPVIIFDDFTTASKFVDFPFKVKSSAMKILHTKRDEADTRYLFYLMQTIKINHDTHKRYWISEYSKIEISLPPLTEQKKIVAHLESISQKIKVVKELQNTTENELDVLERSILSKAFSGKLTL